MSKQQVSTISFLEAGTSLSYTYPRRQNNWGWRVVDLRNIERLGEQVGRVELIEGNCSRGLGSLGDCLRGHKVRIRNTHSTKLLGHLCDAWSYRRSISLSHLGGIGTVYRLLLRLRVCPISSTGRRLASQSGIGTRSKLKGLSSISSLLLSSSVRLGRSFPGLFNRGSKAGGMLVIPLLGRVAPLWRCHRYFVRLSSRYCSDDLNLVRGVLGGGMGFRSPTGFRLALWGRSMFRLWKTVRELHTNNRKTKGASTKDGEGIEEGDLNCGSWRQMMRCSPR